MNCNCFSYTKLNVNVVSLILSLIFTIMCTGFILSFNKVEVNTKIGRYYGNTNDISMNALNISNNVLNRTAPNVEEAESNNILNEETLINNSIEWKIEIPKIGLVANISEGTSKELLDEFVGHFESTRERFR